MPTRAAHQGRVAGLGALRGPGGHHLSVTDVDTRPSRLTSLVQPFAITWGQTLPDAVVAGQANRQNRLAILQHDGGRLLDRGLITSSDL